MINGWAAKRQWNEEAKEALTRMGKELALHEPTTGPKGSLSKQITYSIEIR